MSMCGSWFQCVGGWASTALKADARRYASYWDTVHRASGHMARTILPCPWTNRICHGHCRYTELHPLRARLCVSKPECWSVKRVPATRKTKVVSRLMAPGAVAWPLLPVLVRECTSPQGDGIAALSAIRQRTSHRSTMGKCRIRPGLLETATQRGGLTPQKRRTPEKRSLRSSQPGELHVEP